MPYHLATPAFGGLIPRIAKPILPDPLAFGKNTTGETAQDLQDLIAELEKLLIDWKKRLPAHSIPPAMIAEMDELDEKINNARKRLVTLEND
jgi:hypothetical protein